MLRPKLALRTVRFLQMPDTHTALTGAFQMCMCGRLSPSAEVFLHNDKTKLLLKPFGVILGIPQVRNSKSFRNYD